MYVYIKICVYAILRCVIAMYVLRVRMRQYIGMCMRELRGKFSSASSAPQLKELPQRTALQTLAPISRYPAFVIESSSFGHSGATALSVNLLPCKRGEVRRSCEVLPCCFIARFMMRTKKMMPVPACS